MVRHVFSYAMEKIAKRLDTPIMDLQALMVGYFKLMSNEIDVKYSWYNIGIVSHCLKAIQNHRVLSERTKNHFFETVRVYSGMESFAPNNIIVKVYFVCCTFCLSVGPISETP